MHARLSRRRRRTPVTALVVGVALAIALPASTLGTARHPNPSFEYLALTDAAAGGTVIALINSGQTFDGVTFEGIPDGLGAVPVGQGKRYVDLYVAFEQSHVPFQGFADFEDSSVQRARLDRASLVEARLPSANLQGATLRDANLRGANLSGAALSGAKVNGARLTRADLTGAILVGADLRNADLTGANLHNARLSGADLRGARLDEVDFAGVDTTSCIGCPSRSEPARTGGAPPMSGG